MRTSAFRLFMIVFTITINTCLFGKADELEGEPIPLEYNEPGDDGKPIIRGPVIIPFSALYCEAAACVNVSFLLDIGTVSISLTNLNTSTCTSFFVDSHEETYYFPILGGIGLYRLDLQKEDGSLYYGYFLVVNC